MLTSGAGRAIGGIAGLLIVALALGLAALFGDTEAGYDIAIWGLLTFAVGVGLYGVWRFVRSLSD
jgi:hypothetical protein